MFVFIIIFLAMRYLLFLFIVNTLSFTSTAQTYAIFHSIEDLRKSGPVKDGSVAYVLGYKNKADGGGGLYIYSDTANVSDDGGGIIKAAGVKGAYIHEVRNGIVNLKWWGIRPLSATGTTYNLAADDIAQEFKAAVKFLHNRAPGAQLLIDAGTGGVWGDGTYYCSETWNLDKEIIITGTKAGVGYPSTKITWDPRKLCINVPASAYRVTLEHLLVTQIHGNFDFGDSTGHGIYARAQLYIDNMKFLNLAGDGIRIEACADPKHPIYGNADFSILKNVAVNYTNHGLYIKGCDANKITVDKFEASNTRRWGVYDDGFLGNDYKEPHFSATGYAGNRNQTTVNYKGKVYTPKWGMDHIDVTGKRPDLYPQFWNEHGGAASVAWDSSKRYWSAGTFALINDNAWNMIWSPYTEEGQAPGYLNTRSELRNGTRGTTTVGGSQSRTLFGTQYNSAKTVFPGILVGEHLAQYEAPNVPLHAVQDFAKSGSLDIARFESMGNAAWVNIKNSVGNGYVNVNESGHINLYPVKGSGLGVGDNSIHPLKDKAVSLGNAANRWANLYLSDSGDNASSGTAILSQGKVTIRTKSVSSSSKIFLTVASLKGEQGFLSPTNISDGSSFMIQSSSKTDASSVNWFILN